MFQGTPHFSVETSFGDLLWDYNSHHRKGTECGSQIRVTPNTVGTQKDAGVAGSVL
jgi:hypothetical protein